MSRVSREKPATDFALRFREARDAKGLSRKEFVEIAGLSEDQVKDYENGRGYPRAASLEDISRVLGVSIQWLLTGEEWSGPVKAGQQELKIEEKLSSYIELVTDPDMLLRVNPTAVELRQLYLAAEGGRVRDWVQLMGLLNDIRSGKVPGR